jgi:predicted ArsR family transcriptional regulator
MNTALLGDLERINEHHFVEKVQLMKALQKKYGDSAIEIAMNTLAENVREEWQTIGELHGKNDIEELVHVIWEHFGKSGGFEFQVEHQEEGVQIYCTKCPLADMARMIGEPEWGFRFYCATDPIMVEAFNPNIGLHRTKTLMEGHEHCNHFYYYKKPE